MKNITVSLDDETYRRARIVAAERGSSVSGLVRRFLAGLGTGDADIARLKAEERALRARITDFRVADPLPGDDFHKRDPS